MRIGYIGAVEFSRRVLERLIDARADIVGVCAQREPGINADHFDLSALCESRGIPWTYAANVNSDETLHWLAARKPDVLFCMGWSRLLHQRLLSLAPMGAIGFHPAALPANRGRHPVIWALVLGLRETASTFFFLDVSADGGDIISQERIEITDEDDAATLNAKITDCALKQVETFVPQLAAGTLPRVEQDTRRANVWRKRGVADGQIDWRMTANGIHNLVRALTKPYVGAHFLHRGAPVIVWKTEIVPDVPLNIEPGKVLEIRGEGTTVMCGGGGLRLIKTEPTFEPAQGEYL